MTSKPNTYTQDPTVDEVIQQMINRSNQGMTTYGKSIRDNSEYDIGGWLNHAQQEMTDAAVYLEKIKEELQLMEYYLGHFLSIIKAQAPITYARLIEIIPPHYRKF